MRSKKMAYIIEKITENHWKINFTTSAAHWMKLLESDAGKTKHKLERFAQEEFEKFAEDCERIILSESAFHMEQMKLDKPLVFSIKAELSPKVILGQYKNLKVFVKEDSYTEADKRELALMELLIQGSGFGDVTAMIEKMIQQMTEEYASRLSQEGLSLEQFYKMTGSSLTDLMKQFQPAAERRVKGRLVLYAVAKAEGIKVSPEELDYELKRLSALYLMPADQIRKLLAGSEGRKLKQDILINKTMRYLMDQNEFAVSAEAGVVK
ncbi:MAG: hypothetical protein E7250_13465 [Paenibacillaceae bacterium]|nr:hypothetical protein [Paenibacillaceae bacterium]